jgi:hypothetical protein
MAMTHAEQAKKLIDIYIPHVKWKMGQEDCLIRAVECALIDVSNTITALEEHQWQNRHIIEDHKLIKQELKKL